jgi:hypothetical protein
MKPANRQLIPMSLVFDPDLSEHLHKFIVGPVGRPVKSTLFISFVFSSKPFGLVIPTRSDSNELPCNDRTIVSAWCQTFSTLNCIQFWKERFLCVRFQSDYPLYHTHSVSSNSNSVRSSAGTKIITSSVHNAQSQSGLL